MSDFELNNEERLALSEILSMKSQDSNGDFFGSRDEIQSMLESRYSSEINPERINDICNEILSPMFDGGISPKYENVKSYMENYEVFMEDPSPVDFNPKGNDSSASEQSHKADISSNHKEKSNSANLNDNAGDEKTKPRPSSSDNNVKTEVQKPHDKRDHSSQYEKEKERKEDLDRRTRESYEAAEQLRRDAATIRRDAAAKMYMNPYALMGYTFAQMGIQFERIAGNLLASRAFSFPINLGRKFFGLEPKTFSGKKFLGLQASHNAKDPRSHKWETPENNTNGAKILDISKNLVKYIEAGNFPLVQSELNRFHSLLTDNHQRPDLDLKGKKSLKDNMAKVTSLLNERDKNDEPGAKEAKKKLAKVNKQIVKMIAKLFGVKIKDDGPEMSGP